MKIGTHWVHASTQTVLAALLMAMSTLASAKSEPRQRGEPPAVSERDADTLAEFETSRTPLGERGFFPESGRPARAFTSEQALEEIENRLRSIEDMATSRKARVRTTEWSWEELESFQRSLWRAMALDPAQMDDSQIPPYIHPRALTRQLAAELVRLERSRAVAIKYGVESEFDDYLAFCRQLILWRDEGLFRHSRLVAKRGVLEEKYMRLSDRVASRAARGIEVGVLWSEGERDDLLKALNSVRGELAAIRVDRQRRPASMDLGAGAPVKTLLWVLAPLLFLTGFVGGLIWGRRSAED